MSFHPSCMQCPPVFGSMRFLALASEGGRKLPRTVRVSYRLTGLPAPRLYTVPTDYRTILDGPKRKRVVIPQSTVHGQAGGRSARGRIPSCSFLQHLPRQWSGRMKGLQNTACMDDSVELLKSTHNSQPSIYNKRSLDVLLLIIMCRWTHSHTRHQLVARRR